METRDRLTKFYRDRLDSLKPVLSEYLERALNNDHLATDLIEEYAIMLFYHEVLKNEQNPHLASLCSTIARFASQDSKRPMTIELAYIIYRMLDYDIDTSRFSSKPESPNIPHGMFM